MRNVYLDYSATTPVKEEVLKEMLPYFTEKFGNPSSLYDTGLEAKAAVTHAREQVAALIHADPKEVFFTAGGTESDNWALFGACDKLKEKGNHIITTKIEHHAILHSCAFLEKHGFDVTYVGIDKDGRVNLKELEDAITDKTILISVMMVNNEIGTVQPIREIAKIAKAHKILFHTDAVQAIGSIHFDVKKMGIDMLSLAGHKFRGPRGTGVLYVKNGIQLEPLVYGGGQERGLVSGTENTAGFIGLAAAMQDACEHLDEKMGYVKKLTDKLVKGIMENIPYSHYTGDPVNRLPGTASFVFEAIEGEGLILRLDNAGVCGSTGSACSTGSLDPSHVLMAIGLPHEIAHGSLRLTLGEQNTEEDVDYVIETVTDVVKTLRSMSPVWENGKPNLTAATELHAH